MPLIQIPGTPRRLVLPSEGGPKATMPGADALVGTDGNAFAVMARVDRILAKAGATKEYREAYVQDATSDDYDWLIHTSVVYLEAGPR